MNCYYCHYCQDLCLWSRSFYCYHQSIVFIKYLHYWFVRCQYHIDYLPNYFTKKFITVISQHCYQHYKFIISNGLVFIDRQGLAIYEQTILALPYDNEVFDHQLKTILQKTHINFIHWFLHFWFLFWRYLQYTLALILSHIYCILSWKHLFSCPLICLHLLYFHLCHTYQAHLFRPLDIFLVCTTILSRCFAKTWYFLARIFHWKPIIFFHIKIYFHFIENV